MDIAAYQVTDPDPDDQAVRERAGGPLAPGGVAVGHNGTLSVTTGTVFGPGGGAVVRINP